VYLQQSSDFGRGEIRETLPLPREGEVNAIRSKREKKTQACVLENLENKGSGSKERKKRKENGM